LKSQTQILPSTCKPYRAAEKNEEDTKQSCYSKPEEQLNYKHRSNIRVQECFSIHYNDADCYIGGGKKVEDAYLRENEGTQFFHKNKEPLLYAVSGYWKNDSLQKGIVFYRNGTVWIGSFNIPPKSNIIDLSGYGRLILPNLDEYVGEVKDGLKHGKGYYVYSEKVADINNLGDLCEENIFPLRYEGDWADDCFNGFGVMYYTHGCRYNGFWKDNEQHGEGNFYHKDELVNMPSS